MIPLSPMRVSMPRSGLPYTDTLTTSPGPRIFSAAPARPEIADSINAASQKRIRFVMVLPLLYMSIFCYSPITASFQFTAGFFAQYGWRRLACVRIGCRRGRGGGRSRRLRCGRHVGLVHVFDLGRGAQTLQFSIGGFLVFLVDQELFDLRRG